MRLIILSFSFLTLFSQSRAADLSCRHEKSGIEIKAHEFEQLLGRQKSISRIARFCGDMGSLCNTITCCPGLSCVSSVGGNVCQ